MEGRDIVQHVLFSLSQRSEELADLSTRDLEAYAKRAAIHRLSNVRRSERRAKHLENEWVRQQDGHVPGAEQLLACAQAIAQCHRLLERLPADLYCVAVAREIEGLSTSETAKELRISESAVKSRLHRARNSLRQMAEQFGRSAGRHGKNE